MPGKANPRENRIGTLEIFRSLTRHWSAQEHPVFRLTREPAKSVPTTRRNPLKKRIRQAVTAVVVLIIFTAIAQVYFTGRATIGLFIGSMCAAMGIGGIGAGFTFLAYLWPLIVAVAASNAVIQERERRTWDVLLTTPLDWADLVLAKMAVVLGRFQTNGGPLILWMQSFLLVMLFVGLVPKANGGQALEVFQVIVILLAMAEFAIERAQDYSLAVLIGLATSLFSSSRQIAGAMALLTASSLVIVRLVLTAVVLTMIQPGRGGDFFLLVATGPAGVIPLAFDIPVAALLLVLIPLVREWLIRVLFAWLVRRLGDVPQAA